MKNFITSTGFSRAAGRGIIRVALVVSAVSPLFAPSTYAIGDDTVGDREIAFQFLDEVEEAVGFEKFDSISASLGSQLVLTLGRLDRDWLTPEAFIQHVRQVEIARERFYNNRKLSQDDVVAYLLPYRIRHELTSKPDWMIAMANHFMPVTQKSATADEAARAVIAWMIAHLKVLEPALSYPLPMRGDLDPLTVLKGGHGNEIDCAIFGVAALRASGVAARFVWAPALRGEKGGKAWLEYLSENTGDWVPWVPSLGTVEDQASEIRSQIGSKILFVMARPEAPLEVTDSYSKTVRITIHSSDESLAVQLLAVGCDQLLSARGNEITRNERHATIGAGSIVIAASFGMCEPCFPSSFLQIRSKSTSPQNPAASLFCRILKMHRNQINHQKPTIRTTQ